MSENNDILSFAAKSAASALGAKVLPDEICAIANLHTKLAAGAALIPVPAAQDLAMASNIWYMYKRINDSLGISFSKTIMKTIISGVIANLGATGLLILAADVAKFIPGIGTLLGTALDMAIFPAATYTSAFVYLKAISAIASKETLTDEELKKEVEIYMKNNKETVNAVFKEAKKEYKNISKSDALEAKKKLENITEEQKQEKEENKQKQEQRTRNTEIKVPPIPEAYKHYAEAVASGNGDAMYEIGHGYEEGIGVRTSTAEAIKWYRVAKKAGSLDAAKRLRVFGLT